MKILIGVCGIGNGHCIRQREICRELVNRGHDVRILTFGEGGLFFTDEGIPVYPVYVPYITYRRGMLDVWNLLKRNFGFFFRGTIRNIKVFSSLKMDSFLPDICISDYEPVTARFAYSFGCPLICIDQQSKFLFMDTEMINGFSNLEEKKRLSFFFPKVDKRIVFSFYRVNAMLDGKTEILYPIIRREILRRKGAPSGKNVVVYLSKYIDIPVQQTWGDLLSLFCRFPDYRFIVFSNELHRTPLQTAPNISILANDVDLFASALASASAAVSTAGHTLISECIWLKVPLFVIPLPTFDQQFCGSFLLQNNLGFSSDLITFENMSAFLGKLDLYRQNMNSCRQLVQPTDSLHCVVDAIEALKRI